MTNSDNKHEHVKGATEGKKRTLAVNALLAQRKRLRGTLALYACAFQGGAICIDLRFQ